MAQAQAAMVNVRQLGDSPALRQLLLLGGIALAVAVGLWMFRWSQEPGYAPLYSGLADRDAADVAEALLDLLEFYSAEGALGQDTTLEVPTLTSSGRGEAAAEPVTFHACFRISDVVHLFRTTHLILRQGKRSRGSLLLTCLHPEKLVAGTCRRL